MKTRLAVVLASLLWLGGCAKSPAPPDPQPEPVPAAETGDASSAPADTADAATTADGGDWKYELGNTDAKVLVECFFPLNEDHGWVKELNQRIADKWPDAVHVVHYDWWTDEGNKELEKHNLAPCSYYLIDGEQIAAKSQALGGWTEGMLMAAIQGAVDGKDPQEAAKAYLDSGAAAKEEQASDAPKQDGGKAPE